MGVKIVKFGGQKVRLDPWMKVGTTQKGERCLRLLPHDPSLTAAALVKMGPKIAAKMLEKMDPEVAADLLDQVNHIDLEQSMEIIGKMDGKSVSAISFHLQLTAEERADQRRGDINICQD